MTTTTLEQFVQARLDQLSAYLGADSAGSEPGVGWQHPQLAGQPLFGRD